MDFKKLKEKLMAKRPLFALEYDGSEIAKMMPEFGISMGFNQYSTREVDDIYTHTLKVVDNTCPDLRVRIAALFHDVGKINCLTVDRHGECHFYGHSLESDYIFMKYKDKFDLSNEDIILIQKLIHFHDTEINERSIKQFLNYFNAEEIELLYSLKLANILTTNEKKREERIQELEKEIEFFKSNCHEKEQCGLLMDIDGDNDRYSYIDLYDENILLLALWLNDNPTVSAYKAKFNFDDCIDLMFDNSFILGIDTPKGMITYRIKLDYWEMFNVQEIPYSHVYNKDKPAVVRKKLESVLHKGYTKK